MDADEEDGLSANAENAAPAAAEAAPVASPPMANNAEDEIANLG